MPTIKRIAQLKTPEMFREHLHSVGANIPFDDTLLSPSPFAEQVKVNSRTIGNRFCILPMEGWDGTMDGGPSDLTRRRWQRFGQSGAKLIWGGEAVAVARDGLEHPNQLMITEQTLPGIQELRNILVAEHSRSFGQTDDLYIGLQLTHSGRFSKPWDNTKREPRILYRHPLLDRKFGIQEDHPLLTDSEVSAIVDAMVRAAKLSAKAGYDFVDVKHCHGYLGHEFLSAVDRPGRYGGSFENRTRFLREIVQGIQAEVPGLEIGVRLSAADFVPFKKGDDEAGTGVPEDFGAIPSSVAQTFLSVRSDEHAQTGMSVPRNAVRYRYAFGGDGTGTGVDLTEPIKFLQLCRDLGIKLICMTLGSPYYCPHMQRPAIFPPSDGYAPPEEPLIGVQRHIDVAAALKAAVPELLYVGSGYTYLQEWLPRVGQAVLRAGQADFIGLGRLVLSYPDLPADVIAGRPLQTKQICRTFSDCTTAPRNGLVSGCYPLDAHYKAMPEALELKKRKGKANE